VVAVTDGDTLEVARPDGSRLPVRLIGTNTPEQDECFAEEAARVLEVLAPIGGVVGLTRDESDRDQFGRALRYVWQGGMSVNEETVRRGAAVARRYEPDAAMADRLDAAQAAAQRAARGLWAPDACGTPADADLSIVDVHYDAPGDDTTSLNEEWVLVRNDGDNLVDLTGWALKDESASHRYAFPAGFTLAGGEEVRVLTGCGPDFGTSLHWCNRGSAVWNNDGDTAFLLDPAGNTHDTFAYDG
jgi:micrococcal nuclease